MSTPLHLEKAYQDWILRMHDRYDEEIDHGEDQPVLIVSPANKKSIRISSDGGYKKDQQLRFLKAADLFCLFCQLISFSFQICDFHFYSISIWC